MDEIKIKGIRKYKTKLGDVEKVYDQKKYNDTYYQSHKDKYTTKVLCVDCNKNISISNMSNHKNTNKHILKSKYKIDINNL